MALPNSHNFPDGFEELQGYYLSFGYSQLAEGEKRLETRVCNLQNETEQRFEGLAADQALTWIQHQTRARMAVGQPTIPQDKLSQELPKSLSAGLGTAPYHKSFDKPLLMEFVDLVLEEVTVEAMAPAGAPSSLPRTLRASGRLRVYDDTAAEKPYRVEFLLLNLDTADSRMAAADQGVIQANELAREIYRDFPIPARGRYQIVALVRAAPNSDVIAESRGPVLRVVE